MGKKGRIFSAKTTQLYLMIAPAFILIVLFQYVPIPGRLIAFTDWRVSGFRGWVGLANFEFLFGLDYFWQAFANQWVLIVLGYLFRFPAPIVLALLLNELHNRPYKKALQTVTTLPHFINWVVISGIFITILSPRYGYVNDVIRFFGGEPLYFLSKPELFPGLLTFLRIWKEVGYAAIIYLAALSGIDPELYEAAVVDGANRWRQTWHVTLPGLGPTIVILFVLSFTDVFSGLFEPVFMLKNPMISSRAEILDTYIFEVGLGRARYGLGAAAGLFKATISIVLVIAANRLSRRLMPDGRSIL